MTGTDISRWIVQMDGGDMVQWEKSGETGADDREPLDLERVYPTAIGWKRCMGS